MKKKVVSILLCSALVLLSFAGCGSKVQEVPEAGESNQEVSEQTTESSGEKTQITFSHLYVGEGSFNNVIAPAVEKFNQEQSDYEIIVEEMPQEAYLTQTNARGTADDLAELVLVNGTMMKTFSDTGVIIPLTDVVANAGLESMMKPGLLADGTNIDDGVVYSLPLAAGTFGFILYNQEIFDEAGVEEFPKTLEEFKVACDKISAAGYIPMGLGGKDLWASDALLFSAFVNNFVGNEWYSSMRRHDGTASFEDAEFIEALAQYQQVAANGTFNEDFVSISNDERLGLYLNKKVAMVSAGDWECKNIVEADVALGDVTKVATWPKPAESKAENSMVLSAAWGIAMGSRITEEQKVGAEIFIKDYFYTQESGRNLIEQSNEFPAWIVDEYDASSLSAPAILVQESIKTATGCMNWDASLDATVKEVYQRGLQDLLMGSITPEELAAEMQAEYELVGE